jgi:hypothetical protein
MFQIWDSRALTRIRASRDNHKRITSILSGTISSVGELPKTEASSNSSIWKTYRLQKSMKITDFWDVTPCNLVHCYWYFEGISVMIYRLHGTKSQRIVIFIIITMRTSNAPIMSAAVHQEINMKCSVINIQLKIWSTSGKQDWTEEKKWKWVWGSKKDFIRKMYRSQGVVVT